MASSVTEAPNVEYGDREVALGNEILRTVVGSGLHGIEIPGTDDHDEMGIYVELPGEVLGVREKFEIPFRDSYVYRTQPEGRRSGPGDVDLVLYSFRKFLHLAVKGNPTVLMPLYAPEDKVVVATWLGDELRNHRDLFLSQFAVERFLSYMWAQHDRMLGYGKRSAVPNRPELIEAHGFDTKYAAHALRLAFQGYEIARYGRLTLPMDAPIRGLVLDAKKGKIPLEEIAKIITSKADAIRRMLADGTTAVPETADFQGINEMATRAHMAWWADKGLIR